MNQKIVPREKLELALHDVRCSIIQLATQLKSDEVVVTITLTDMREVVGAIGTLVTLNGFMASVYGAVITTQAIEAMATGGEEAMREVLRRSPKMTLN